MTELSSLRWVTPERYYNGWYSDPSYRVGYTRTDNGLLMLRGIILGGSSGTHMFYLPPDFTPARVVALGSLTYTGSAFVPVSVNIYPNGAVMLSIYGTVGIGVYLDGLIAPLGDIF